MTHPLLPYPMRDVSETPLLSPPSYPDSTRDASATHMLANGLNKVITRVILIMGRLGQVICLSWPQVLGNGPQVLGNGNVPLVLGNGPHLLGIKSHSGLCRIRTNVVRDCVVWRNVIRPTIGV